MESSKGMKPLSRINVTGNFEKTIIFQIPGNEFRYLIKNFKYFIVLLSKQ